jgi:hypothetical protein
MDLSLAGVKSPDHLGDPELLVVQVEHGCVELDERPTLGVGAADTAVFVERIPPPAKAKSHPHVVGGVLGVIGKVIGDEVDGPPMRDQSGRNALAETAVEEELRRLV